MRSTLRITTASDEDVDSVRKTFLSSWWWAFGPALVWIAEL